MGLASVPRRSVFEVQPCCDMYQDSFPLWLRTGHLSVCQRRTPGTPALWRLAGAPGASTFQLLFGPVCSSFASIPASAIAGSDGHFMFSFLRNCRTGFYSDCIIHIPARHKDFPTCSPAVVYVCVHSSHPSGCEVVSQCGFFNSSWHTRSH